MTKKLLRVCHAIVRFDNIPHDVTSDVLERTELPLYGDILEWEYCFRHNITMLQFEKKLQADLNARVGDEILRLGKFGHYPTLYLDFNFSGASYFRFEISNDTLRKLSRDSRSIELSYPSLVFSNQLSIVVSSNFIKILNLYRFSLEIV